LIHRDTWIRCPLSLLTKVAKQQAAISTAPKLIRTGMAKSFGSGNTTVEANERSSKMFCKAISEAENSPLFASGVV
jgi:hypothetical protein